MGPGSVSSFSVDILQVAKLKKSIEIQLKLQISNILLVLLNKLQIAQKHFLYLLCQKCWTNDKQTNKITFQSVVFELFAKRILAGNSNSWTS